MTTKKKITETINDLIIKYKKDFELIPKTINIESCGFFAEQISDKLKDKSIKVRCEAAPKAFGVDLDRMGLPQHVFVEHKKKYYDAERPEGVKRPSELPFYQRFKKHIPEWKNEAKDRKLAEIERAKHPPTIQEIKKELLEDLETEKELLEISQKKLKEQKYQKKSDQNVTKRDILDSEKEILKITRKLQKLT